MEKVHGFIDQGDQTITIWLSGDTEKEIRLLARLKKAFIEELNQLISEEDWDNCRDVLETGGELAHFIGVKIAEAERRAKDAAV